MIASTMLLLYKYNVTNVSREHGWEPLAVEAKLKELREKGLVKAMEHGAFTRVVHEDTQVQVIFDYKEYMI